MLTHVGYSSFNLAFLALCFGAWAAPTSLTSQCIVHWFPLKTDDSAKIAYNLSAVHSRVSYWLSNVPNQLTNPATWHSNCTSKKKQDLCFKISPCGNSSENKRHQKCRGEQHDFRNRKQRNESGFVIKGAAWIRKDFVENERTRVRLDRENDDIGNACHEDVQHQLQVRYGNHPYISEKTHIFLRIILRISQNK